MAQIQHIAVASHDTLRLAEFYKQTFGMMEVSRVGSEDHPAFYMSDGHMNLALVPAKPGEPDGIAHFGFHVDDLESTKQTAESLGADLGPGDMSRREGGAEDFVLDPSGIRVDLSVAGWPL
jgi:catechol 2,3-dioxygenase-like lactoylglutathione lyase family enzyme